MPGVVPAQHTMKPFHRSRFVVDPKLQLIQNQENDNQTARCDQ